VVSEERRGGARDREEVLAHPLQGAGGRGRGVKGCGGCSPAAAIDGGGGGSVEREERKGGMGE
jgi:hypothetical protein